MAKIPAKPPRLVASQSSSPKIGQPMLLLSSHVRESTKNKRYPPVTPLRTVCGDLLCPRPLSMFSGAKCIMASEKDATFGECVCVDRGLCLICVQVWCSWGPLLLEFGTLTPGPGCTQNRFAHITCTATTCPKRRGKGGDGGLGTVRIPRLEGLT